jgi:hypothetical protein
MCEQFDNPPEGYWFLGVHYECGGTTTTDETGTDNNEDLLTLPNGDKWCNYFSGNNAAIGYWVNGSFYCPIARTEEQAPPPVEEPQAPAEEQPAQEEQAPPVKKTVKNRVSTGTKTMAATKNVRSGPGTGYRKIGLARKGTTVKITKVRGSWGYDASRGGWVYIYNATK